MASGTDWISINGKEGKGEKFARSLTNWVWLGPAVVTALTVWLYGGILAGLARSCWMDPQQSQGLLIPPLALYVAWLRNRSLLATPAAPDNRGMWLVGLACIMFVCGNLGAELFLSRMSFMVLTAGLIWTFWGRKRLRILILPLLLLATMVPIPMIAYNAVSVPLKLMASGAATRIAQALGVVVYREGNVIQLARISVGVDEACNGLASLSSLFIASLLLGLIECDRLAARILLVLLSIPLAVVVNIIRITGTAIIADYHREIALGFYHSFSGWLTFLMALAALYATAKLLNAVMARYGSEL